MYFWGIDTAYVVSGHLVAGVYETAVTGIMTRASYEKLWPGSRRRSGGGVHILSKSSVQVALVSGADELSLRVPVASLGESMSASPLRAARYYILPSTHRSSKFPVAIEQSLCLGSFVCAPGARGGAFIVRMRQAGVVE